MTDIKPCPFCGGEAYVKNAYEGRKSVICRCCLVRTFIGWESEVVDAWNRRTM